MAYDHKKVEGKWQEYWDTERFYHFNRNSKKRTFAIDVPPRYANAALHLGHATSYTHIDFAARYKRLRGFEVFVPLCADVNGMPIEVSVEKKFKVNKHNTPREKLVKMCEDFANSNITEMTRQFKILGHSFDPSIFYQTNAPHYRRLTQISFIKMFKKGLVYKKDQPITWCTNCGTALASAEVEYEERDTQLNHILFSKDDGSTVTIATSRPELLCACQMVAVNPEDPRYKDLAGKHLITPLFKKRVKVIHDDKVQVDFGTGVVMICTIGDKEDLEWVKRYKLPIEDGIEKDGRMTVLAGKYKGMTVSDARKAIIEDLERERLLMKKEPLKQSVGACWRCHSPVEFLQVPQWFLKTLDFQDKVLEIADKIKWHPEFMKVKLRNWTLSLAWDWCISRQRYFATPIPLWECMKEGCDGVVLPREEDCYLDPTSIPPPVKQCPKCGGPLAPCKDVFDTWMDSSLSALFIAGWERDPDLFKRIFPTDLRPQSHDIIRTWAFYTILRTHQLVDDIPWRDIMISGFIMAPDGTPMHTSRGNVIDPLPILDEHGADALRYFAGTISLGMDHPFQLKEVVHGRRLVEKVHNIGTFVNKALEAYVPGTSGTPPGDLTLMDRWVLTKFSKTVKEVTEAMEEYAFDKAMRSLERFIWHELADHYLELIKHRIYAERPDQRALETLYKVTVGALKMLSIFQPHVTEEVYSGRMGRLDGAKSITLSTWPEPALFDDEAEKVGDHAKDVVAAIRNYKSQKGLALNAALERVELLTDFPLASAIEDMKGTVRANILEIGDAASIERRPSALSPVRAKIGPEFRQRAGAVVDALSKADPEKVAKDLDEHGSYPMKLGDGTGVIIKKEHVNIEQSVSYSGVKVDVVNVGGTVLLLKA